MNEIALVLLGLAFAAGAVCLAVVLPIVGFVRTSRALREVERAHSRIEALARVVQDLARERREAYAAAAGAEAHESPAESAHVGGSTVDPATTSPRPPEPSAGEWGDPGPRPVEPVSDAANAAAAVSSDAVRATPPVPLDSLRTDTASASLNEPVDAVRAEAADGPPPPPQTTPSLPSFPSPPALRPPRPAGPRAHGPSLEQRIGKRWLLYVGIGAIVLGASYLVKLAFDNEWITPAMRVGLIALGGGVLVAIGLRFADRGMSGFGHLLAGGGIAVLYVSIYAALHLYDLVDRGPAFVAMILVTAFGAWLSDRRSDLGLAMVALIGGFATPFLIGGDRDAYLALFTYVTVLGSGATFLARRHEWPVLTLTAFGLTALTFGAWAAASYSGERYLAVQAFLTAWFVLFLLSVRFEAGPTDHEPASAIRATPPQRSVGALHAGVAVIVQILAPVLYHAASLSNLVRHPLALLIYFILVTLAAVLYAAEDRRTWARLVGWLAAWLPFLGWLSEHPSAAGTRVTLFALFGLHLIAELRMLGRDPGRLDAVDTLLLHLNGLGLLAGLLLMFPRSTPPGWPSRRPRSGAAMRSSRSRHVPATISRHCTTWRSPRRVRPARWRCDTKARG